MKYEIAFMRIDYFSVATSVKSQYYEIINIVHIGGTFGQCPKDRRFFSDVFPSVLYEYFSKWKNKKYLKLHNSATKCHFR